MRGIVPQEAIPRRVNYGNVCHKTTSQGSLSGREHGSRSLELFEYVFLSSPGEAGIMGLPGYPR